MKDDLANKPSLRLHQATAHPTNQRKRPPFLPLIFTFAAMNGILSPAEESREARWYTRWQMYLSPTAFHTALLVTSPRKWAATCGFISRGSGARSMVTMSKLTSDDHEYRCKLHARSFKHTRDAASSTQRPTSGRARRRRQWSTLPASWADYDTHNANIQLQIAIIEINLQHFGGKPSRHGRPQMSPLQHPLKWEKITIQCSYIPRTSKLSDK